MKKKSHLLKNIMIIFSTLLCFLILIPLILLFSLFYDDSFNKTIYKSDVNLADIGNNYFYDGIENSKDNKKILIEVDENSINDILHTSMSSFNLLSSNITNYLKNYYLNISEKSYTFTFDLNYSFFKTKLYIDIIPSYIEDESNYLNDHLLFEIKNIKVARLSLTSIVSKYLTKKINDKQIEEYFSSIGLHVNSDIANRRLYYKLSNFITDTKALIKQQKNYDLFSNILNFSSRYHLINSSFFNNDALKFSLELDNFTNNKELETKEKETNLDINPYLDKLAKLVNGKIIELNKDEDVFNYLIFGYDYLNDENKKYISSLDLTSIGILNNELYKGIIFIPSESLMDLLSNQIKINTDKISLAKIDENMINDYLKSKSIIGQSYLLKKYQDGGYAYNHISIDDFYINMMDNKVIINIGVSINGLNTIIIICFDAQKETKNNQLTLKYNQMYYGNLKAEDSFSDIIFNLLEKELKNDSFINVNVTDKEISFNLNNILDEKSKLIIDSLGKNISLSINGKSINDNGYINLSVQ